MNLDEALGRKVFIYFNLHRKVWSVKDWETKRVIGHANEVVLEHATFKVSQAGRKRVLREKRKNVHAGIVGNLISVDQGLNEFMTHMDEVTYNPYKYERFVFKDDTNHSPILSQVVYMANKRVFSS